MPLSKEELLKPRYKVTAPYPDCPFEVGQIIPMVVKERFPFAFEEHIDEKEYWFSNLYKHDECSILYSELVFNQYPHLFKPLQWWEDRRPENMPEYVSYKFMSQSKPIFLKVIKHFTNLLAAYNQYGFITDNDYHSYSKTLPATLEEYQEFQSKK